mmetsp:Transcript_91812/g.137501  ORF Transcript_91812/g.137501 Transcript_91812/m.137501 type:complete len:152 (-) Transcript_91812:97-552(-)
MCCVLSFPPFVVVVVLFRSLYRILLQQQFLIFLLPVLFDVNFVSSASFYINSLDPTQNACPLLPRLSTLGETHYYIFRFLLFHGSPFPLGFFVGRCFGLFRNGFLLFLSAKVGQPIGLFESEFLQESKFQGRCLLGNGRSVHGGKGRGGAK